MIGEFDIIGRYFRPLTGADDGALALRDDAAVFAAPAGRQVVATADAIVAGVHFLPEDPPDRIARKLLRVNLSDLAAMGAEPLGYLMTASWPETITETWIAAFAGGLAADQAAFDIALLGGDTTRTPGPLTLSLTALGSVPTGSALRRNAARPGDLLFVSGTIGDAVLGLRALQNDAGTAPSSDRDYLIERYHLPRPRLALGQALLVDGLAHAAIDVSDGLVADLTHIAEESTVAAVIVADQVPLSAAANAILDRAPELLATLLTGGDDYELLFSAAPENVEAIASVARQLEIPVSVIGRIEAGEGVSVEAADGRKMPLTKVGWTHF